MPQQMSKGIVMPSFKSIIVFCALLLFMSIHSAYARAQSNESKIEVGAQFSVLGGGPGYWLDSPTSVGGGVRLTFNFTRYLALEGELNYLPDAGFNNSERYQGQFGIKTGLRFDRFGVFGKVRPGFIHSDFTDNTNFSLDVGGVLEFYPTKRMLVRFDAGDTIVNREALPVFFNRGLFVPRRNYATHNLQLSAGVGFRF
jgi:outer membrane protein with beta-barrel domain